MKEAGVLYIICCQRRRVVIEQEKDDSKGGGGGAIKVGITSSHLHLVSTNKQW